MKKYAAALLVALLTTAVAHAQTGYAGIAVGAAIPIGAFAATNGAYEKAGYAKTGVSYNLNYIHLFDNNFGLAFTSVYAQNGVNTAAASRGYASYAVPGSSSATGFSGGIIYQFAKVPVYIKAQAGLCVVTTANIVVYDNTGSWNSYTATSAPGLMVIGGIGTKIPLSRHFAFSLSVEAIDCMASPNVPQNGPYPLDYYADINYAQTFINVQAGIGYTFNTGAARNSGGYGHGRRGRY